MAKIRILIVDDNEDTRQGTQRLLETEDNIEIVGIGSNGQEGIDLVRQLSPDVVLMDINMPVMDGLTATRKLGELFPAVQVIIVSVQDDPNYLREAIRAGAVDFVAKPVSSDELVAAIERANQKKPAAAAVQYPQGAPGAGYGMQPASVDGEVIGIIGPKGGVGKTTLAVNLAVAMARSLSDERIILVDGSVVFGDVGVFLNQRSQYNVTHLAEMTADTEGLDQEVLDSTIVTHESGLKLLLAPANPGDAAPFSAEQAVTLLEYLKSKFDYVVVDLSTSFDEMMTATITTAGRLVLVTNATMPALKNARIMLGQLQGAEYAMDHVMLVLNRMQKGGRITAEQIAGFLKHPITLEVPDDPAADEALNRGVALATLDQRRVVSVKAFYDLVQAIENSYAVQDQDQQQDSRRTGFFRR